MKFIKKAVGVFLTAVFTVSAFFTAIAYFNETPLFLPREILAGLFVASAMLIIILFFGKAKFGMFLGTGLIFLSLISLVFVFTSDKTEIFGKLAVGAAAAAFVLFLIYAIFRPADKGDKKIDKTAFEDIY